MFKLTAILCVLAVGSPNNHLCSYGDVPLTDGIKLNNLEDIKKKCVSVNDDNVLVSSLDKHYKFIPFVNENTEVLGLVKL